MNRPQKEIVKNGKRYKRQLTSFLAQEMLFDYATGQLDAERKAAVDEFLEKDKDCQETLEAIRRGMEYSDKLAMTELSPEILAQLKDAESPLSISRKYSSWKEWPDSIRWSITAVVLSALMAAFVVVIPWEKMPAFRQGGANESSVEIAQIPQSNSAVDPQEPPQQDVASAANETSGDEETEIAPDSPEAIAAAKQAQKEAAEEAARQAKLAKSQEADVAVVNAAPEKPVPPAPPIVIKPTTAAPTIVAGTGAVIGQAPGAEPEPPPAPTKQDAKAKGFVYRAFMNLSDLETIGPKITKDIQELGGEKAGEVELGWQRGNGRYYHFALPEAQEEKLLQRLRAYGPVRISKDPHPRVMPTGQSRFILWVDSAG